MTWKCPKCKFTSGTYKVVQKHYGRVHGAKSHTKGAQKKVFTYKPPKHGPPRK